MASEYNLALKATLDTSQVQQELQRLKHSYTAGSSDGNLFSKGAPGAAHMQKIEVQLTKLNSTMSGLQRSIEQLTRALTRAASSGNSRSANGQGSLPVAAQHAYSNAAEKAWLNSAEYKDIKQRVSRVVMSNIFSDMERKALQYRFGNIDSLTFAHNMLQQNGLLGRFGKEWYKQRVASYGNSTVEGQLAARELRAAMRLNRQMATLIGGLLLGGASDIFTSFGYDNLGRGISNLGEGLTAGGAAGMTASLAGLGGKAAGGIGIGIGLATVIAKNISSMEQLAQAVNKAAQAFEDNYKVLHSHTVGVYDSIMGVRLQDRANLLLESGNIAEARKLAKHWNDTAESSKQRLLGMEDPIAAEARIRRFAERRKEAADNALNGTYLEWALSVLGEELFRIMGLPGAATRLQEVKNLVDKEALDLISEMQQKYKEVEADMQRSKSYAGMYEDVVKQIEAGDLKKLQESAAEVAARVALSLRNDLNIAKYKADEQAKATQALANGILGDKLTRPLEKFNKLSEELDKLRNIKDNSLMQAYSIAKNINENGSKMTSEDMKRELAKQGEFEQAAAFVNLRINVIENALQESAARVSLSEQNDFNIAKYKAAGQANATQAFANSVLGDKLTGPLEKFNKLSEELDKLRNLKNNSLMQAYSIAKNISMNGSGMSSEDMRKEFAKQSRFEADAAFADLRIGIIENALANISTGVLAPDLSHVTSLAQYGFNMGEKDDTVERMDKYYSKSLNLQQQIKDKLQEGVKTEAVYN